jgi:hypothetical protein
LPSPNPAAPAARRATTTLFFATETPVERAAGIRGTNNIGRSTNKAAQTCQQLTSRGSSPPPRRAITVGRTSTDHMILLDSKLYPSNP